MAQSKAITNKSLVFKVTRRTPELITPAVSTPYEFKELSDIDDQEALRFHIPIILFYRNNNSSKSTVAGQQDPARVIKEALAKALVPYYPFAGRLRKKPGRKLVVECNGEGIIFIEADADVTLEEFGDIIQPPFPLEQLLYDVPASTAFLDTPLLLFQVTRLKCGAFILALRLNHTVADAAGIVQFLNAMVELAHGAQTPSIQPVWERHLFNIPNSPRVTFEQREYDELDSIKDTIAPLLEDIMVHKSFFFGPTEIATIRRFIPPNQKATTIEILTACLWRSRTIALHPDPEDIVKIMCIVNFRTLANPPIPSGFYGNAFAVRVAISTAAELSTKPIAYALELVQKSKETATEEYIISIDELMVLKDNPNLISMVSNNYFLVSDVTRFGSDKLDFGWGPPLYAGIAKGGVGPIPGLSTFYMSVNNGKGNKGIVIPICLPENAMDIFVKELNGLLYGVSKHMISSSSISSSL